MTRTTPMRNIATAVLAGVLAAATMPSLGQGLGGQPVPPRRGELTPQAIDRPSSIPGRPALVTPQADNNRGTLAPTGLALVWRHGGQPLFRAPAARYFVVCLVPATPSPAGCAWPGQFNMPVTAVPSTPYVHPQFGPQPMTRDYRYTLSAGQAANYLDRRLSWIVGACVGTATATCSFSDRRDFIWSTRNLTAPDFANLSRQSDGQNGSIRVDVVASSDGESPIENFQTRVRFDEAVMDSSTQSCITDVNSQQVALDDTVVTTRGDTYSVLRLGTPRRQPDGVVGIIKGSSANRIPEQIVQVPYMPAAASSQTLARNIGFSFPWGAADTAKRFLIWIVLDSARTIAEANESDNLTVQCLRLLSRG